MPPKPDSRDLCVIVSMDGEGLKKEGNISNREKVPTDPGLRKNLCDIAMEDSVTEDRCGKFAINYRA